LTLLRERAEALCIWGRRWIPLLTCPEQGGRLCHSQELRRSVGLQFNAEGQLSNLSLCPHHDQTDASIDAALPQALAEPETKAPPPYRQR